MQSDFNEVIRKRLNELKKISIEMKQSVLNDSKIDKELINSLISSVHHDSESLKSSNQKADFKNGSLLRNEDRKNPLESEYFYKNLIGQIKGGQGTKTKSTASLSLQSIKQSQNTPNSQLEQQIDQLRQQNEVLYSSLIKLNRQIIDLKKEELNREEQSWKEGLPFQQLQDTVNLFITRLKINEKDYDKIDYQMHDIKLEHEKLIIKKCGRLGQNPRTMYLRQLKEVHYIGQQILLLYFDEQDGINIFIQLKSVQQRDAWDLGLYVNFQISQSSEFDKSLFQQENSHQKSNSSLKLSEDKIEEKDLMRVLTQRRDLYMEAKKMVSSKLLQKKQEKSKNQSFSTQKKLSQKGDQQSFAINGATPNIFESAVSFQSNKIKELNVFNTHNRDSEIQKESRANTSKFNHGDYNFQPLQTYESFNIDKNNKQVQKQKLDVTQSAEQLLIEQKFLKAMKQLKQGYFFTKYSKDGFKPHNKKVYINQTMDRLIWQNSENSSEKKYINIDQIVEVRYGTIDQGIKKHVKNPKSTNYCIIEYMIPGEDKNKLIELGCQKIHFIIRFSEELQMILKKQKSISN